MRYDSWRRHSCFFPFRRRGFRIAKEIDKSKNGKVRCCFAGPCKADLLTRKAVLFWCSYCEVPRPVELTDLSDLSPASGCRPWILLGQLVDSAKPKEVCTFTTPQRISRCTTCSTDRDFLAFLGPQGRASIGVFRGFGVADSVVNEWLDNDK